MKRNLWTAGLLALSLGAVLCGAQSTGSAIEADSARGEQLFQTLSCIQCHSINGQGGKVGPDLGRRIDRSFTPATLAATMWNHAPAMWAAMRQRDIQAGDLNDQAARDLLAYFYSAHFFDRPGDAGRGKALFTAKHCSECHGLDTAKLPAAKPVSQWTALGQPIELINAMWNHAATMRQEFAKRKFGWPSLDSQDLADIQVYLRNLPATRSEVYRVQIFSGANGQALFESKGCAGCHTGSNSLDHKLRGMTLNDIAVEMWSHAPKMTAIPPALTNDEMRELVAFLWAKEYFQDAGNAGAGARVFTAKHCASCHNNPSSGAPKLTGSGRTFSGAVMVSALWHHGPRMLDQMTTQHIAWPRFEGQEMANLIAFLNGGH